MEMRKARNLYIILLLGAAMFAGISGDPDILSDFIVPPSLNPADITRSFFTFTGFRNLRKANLTGRATAVITKATKKEFPGLDGQGISAATILYPPGGLNPPHTHPRASELLMVLEGVIQVGLVDSSNKLFVQTLRAPDLFIFPKGLVHYQVNTNSRSPALAIGMFGGASAGTVALPASLFESGISVDVLAEAFKTDRETISKIIAANA